MPLKNFQLNSGSVGLLRMHAYVCIINTTRNVTFKISIYLQKKKKKLLLKIIRRHIFMSNYN